eukprot:TRINITY_DN3526_c0_g1_i2.p1 TRINITY_DN3526_c0_g1~~TRINITY_DN3526_c0_g1_i2.p1  ORF type:complete len:372 (+),score=74.02 TRINITY_DN3526_c0_g1_i2:65-1180(+)
MLEEGESKGEFEVEFERSRKQSESEVAHGGEGPSAAYVVLFPQSLENKWRQFDDCIIAFVQKRQNKLFYALSSIVTIFTAIEMVVIFPFVLFMLNYDEFATYMAICSLMCSFISQLPKRFLWRYRPYVVNRAAKLHSDKTSSFPSRAVTGGAVFAMIICVGTNIHNKNSTYQVDWWMPFLYLLLPLAASLSRIYFGVHYPTDCIGGFVQGNLIVILSSALFESFNSTCESCLHDDCYSASGTSSVINSSHQDNIDWAALFGFSVLGFAFVFLSSVKPLEFWAKCHYVYGLVWPSFVFRISFLCSPLNPSGASLTAPGDAKPGAFILAAVVAAIGAAVGHKSKGTNMKMRMFVFAAIHTMLLLTLSLWRVHH